MPEGRFRRALLVLAALPLAAAAQTDVTHIAREEFKAAWAEAAVARSAARDSPNLRRYVLHPYLEGARLRYALARVPDARRDAEAEARIRAFLALHGDEPVTRELRRDWLHYLGRRAAWSEFLEAAPPEPEEPALRCHALAARLAERDLDGLREAALALWLESRGAPPECDPVFRWLDDPQRLSDEEIAQRARFAALNRLPMPAALSDLGAGWRALLWFWHRLLARPEQRLEEALAGHNLNSPEPAPPDQDADEALLAAFERVARRDSVRAGPLFERLLGRPSFSEDERHRLTRAYALGLAYDRAPESVRYFARVPAALLDAHALEWRVRAALFHGRWRDAARWLEGLPQPMAAEARWRYWRARAVEARGDTRAARAGYADAAREREYHGFLAAARLGHLPDLRPRPLADDAATHAQLLALPAVQRARELYYCALPEHAAFELRYAQRGLAPDQRAQLVRITAAWGWHAAAVPLLSELQLWDDLWLRFPLPYEREVRAAADEAGMPVDWLHAVVRTESLYNPRAQSGAGARGLMQLLVPTARQVAQGARLPQPSPDDLFRPEVNIALGARYLRELHERFDRHLVLTLAAYNAGPHRIPGWLPESGLPADVWIENIPFNETRAYVQRALSNLVMISWRLHGEPGKLAPLMPPVPAREKGES